MMQPARVLLSNAPPLGDGEIAHHASRVLQEQSGNRQNDYITSGSIGYQPKCPTPLLTENILPAYQPQPVAGQYAAVQLYHSQPQYGQTFTYGQTRHGQGYYHGNDDTWVVKQAKYLYRRFQSSSPYMKYRGRQHKDDKGNGDQKWPDHLEEAFFRGMQLL